MASGAAHALAYVNAVIEIRKIAQAVDFHPLNRVARPIAFAHWLQIADVVKQDRVAVHAGFCRRDPGSSRNFYRLMTITTVDPVVAHMVFVAELHGLFAGNILPSEIWCARKRQYSGKRQSRQKNCGKQTEPGDKIRAAVKNLSHVSVALGRVPP